MNSMGIDLNCDLGESFGTYTQMQAVDLELMKVATSVNIACGFHAGDFSTMRRTVRAAVAVGVAIGAHPGFPDLQGFGRREMHLSPAEVYDMVVYQIGALEAFVRIEGGRLHHVKPHGALYNMAASDRCIAAAIAKATRDVDDRLILYGQSGTCMVTAGVEAGVRVMAEAFADRMYTEAGLLASRTQPGAVVHDDEQVAENAIAIVVRGQAPVLSGGFVSVCAQTLCLHGDTPHALANAVRVRKRLEDAGIQVTAQNLQG